MPLIAPRRFHFPPLDRVLVVSLVVLLAAFLVVLLVEPGAVGRGGR
jgi:hypothetical protein